jgi:hypothetical protein
LIPNVRTSITHCIHFPNPFQSSNSGPVANPGPSDCPRPQNVGNAPTNPNANPIAGTMHTQAQIAAGIYKGEEVAPSPAPTRRTMVKVSSRSSSSHTHPTPTTSSTNDPMDTSGSMEPSTSIVPQAPAPSSSSPQFLAQLDASLNKFWKEQSQVVQDYTQQTNGVASRVNSSVARHLPPQNDGFIDHYRMALRML